MTTPTDALSEPDDYIWVLGLAGDDPDGSSDRGRLFRRDDAKVGRSRIPTDQLQSNVEGFVRAMGKAIGTVPQTLSGFSVESIEISAEVNISGKVSLLGTGGEAGATGGISFKLTRIKADPNNPQVV